MSTSSIQADVTQITDLLERWSSEHLAADALSWLREKQEQIAEGAENWVFFTSFSAVPRYTGKEDLNLSDEQLAEASRVRTGWDPSQWSVDQVGRALILLSLPADDPEQYVNTLDQVYTTADVGESVVLYQSLPLLPHASYLVNRAAEGLRSNITSVFNAVAQRNPFPAENFEDSQWNQMVLKAIFVESQLHPIQGLDERANQELAQMLRDYAHERWAASRSVTPELWRPVGPFATGEMVEDLKRVLEDKDPVNQEAAALALAQSPDPQAAKVLAQAPELKARIEKKELTWQSFSQARLAG